MEGFNEITRQHMGKVLCLFKELMAVFDWVKFFKGQVDGAWPNEISNFRSRDDTVHSSRFQRRIKAREDRP